MINDFFDPLTRPTISSIIHKFFNTLRDIHLPWSFCVHANYYHGKSNTKHREETGGSKDSMWQNTVSLVFLFLKLNIIKEKL